MSDTPRLDSDAGYYYIFVKSITVRGKKLYAKNYGKKAFRIRIKSR